MSAQARKTTDTYQKCGFTCDGILAQQDLPSAGLNFFFDFPLVAIVTPLLQNKRRRSEPPTHTAMSAEVAKDIWRLARH